MTEQTRAKIPPHLIHFVIDQNYDRYTPEDHAVWRFVMRQLRDYLTVHAHPSYLDGLAQTGISPERIPRIADIDAKLVKFGWGAVPVSGFIPPAAFMEFQSIGVLPVASDVRSRDHWLYTPAPDIVHEAAGHAPLLIHAGFSAYLRAYGEVARHALISREDEDQFEAIRALSDLKEDSRATPAAVTAAERKLDAVNSSITHLSEATLLSRMNWWTVEYGLIGSLDQPKLFGAGLLSSVGEARTCLDSDVRKIPLSLECIHQAYNITEPQPQLFVTPDFERLTTVLDQLAQTLSYRRGGAHGLDQAVRAQTVNTVKFDSGICISGRVDSYLTDERGEPAYLKFDGPCQLATDGVELAGQGQSRHAHGYSTPVGPVRGTLPIEASPSVVTRLEFESGVVVRGRIKSVVLHAGRPVVLTWADCSVTRGAAVLFDPTWGEYDMACGLNVISVFSGPADRAANGAELPPAHKARPPLEYTADELRRHALYQDVRALREEKRGDLDQLVARYLAEPEDEWLIGIELAEIATASGCQITSLNESLDPATRTSSTTRLALTLGARLLGS